MILQAEETINIADSLKISTANFVEGFQNDPVGILQGLLSKAVEFGLKVLAALAVYFVGAWLIRRVKHVLKVSFERRNTEGTVASFATSIITIALTILLIIITVSTLGVNTTSLAALLAAGGMAVGMAASGTVQNFAGGIMILAFKPFKAGDFISAQGYSGYVKSVSIASTKIVTLDNREVIIPNGALSNGNIDNYSTNPLRRVDINVNVGYGTDADDCIKVIKSIAAQDQRILDSSTQGADDLFVALSALNASDITFVVRAWTKSENYWGVYFDLNKALYTQLPQNGILFAYPHVTIDRLS